MATSRFPGAPKLLTSGTLWWREPVRSVDDEPAGGIVESPEFVANGETESYDLEANNGMIPPFLGGNRITWNLDDTSSGRDFTEI